jgi:dynactin complex subunit
MTDDQETSVSKLSSDRRTWSIGREIPIAVIFTFVAMTGGQILTQYLVVRDLNNEVRGVNLRLSALEQKFDILSNVVQGGAVPSAINARRIEELERITAQLATLQAQASAKVNENDRRLTVMEARQRAGRER